jgi:tetratricopeptide (TPR) repeat protein
MKFILNGASAVALQQHLRIVDEPNLPVSVRERELEVGRLVLRAVSGRDAFLTRRASAAVAALDGSAARRALRRVVRALAEADDRAVRAALPSYGATLEQHGAHEAAAEVYELAMRLWPGDAAATLHAARAARRSGRRDDALRLYRRAGQECAGDPHMSLLVRIGEALVSKQPLESLTAVVRDARRAADRDALAIAREERARLASRERNGLAVRDLAAAAGRYSDRTDRVRVLHLLAELLSGRGDLLGAREALLAAAEQAGATHRGHSVQRLRTVARSLGDELELRRSRGQAAAGPVTLAPARRPGSRGRSAAPRLGWLRSLLSVPACH